MAGSLGSVLKNDYAETRSEESAVFTALFWNSGGDTFDVELNVADAPDGWTVVILPEKFSIDSSKGSERMALPYADENVGAVPVKIIVKPGRVENTENTVTISARSRLPGSGNLNFFQERRLLLKVDIINVFEPAPEEDRNVAVTVPDDIVIGSNPKEAAASEESKPEDNSSLFYTIIFVGILAVSIAIYRYA